MATVLTKCNIHHVAKHVNPDLVMIIMARVFNTLDNEPEGTFFFTSTQTPRSTMLAGCTAYTA